MTTTLIRTTLVGSYPQPRWLVDHARLTETLPRVRAPGVWRVADAFLQDAQDDAVRLAVADMERAGLDVVTDGEIRRESYSNHFANALDGLDRENPGTVIGRTGKPTIVPRVVGPLRRAHPVNVRDVEFLRAHTNRRIKITVPGPFTLAQQAQNDFYADTAEMALAYAGCVNAELRDLEAAGADVIQLDEPWAQGFPDRAREYAVPAINRAFEGIRATRAVHLCFGYAQFVSDKPEGYSFLPQLADSVADQISIEAAQPGLDPAILDELSGKTILYGVIDLADPHVESAETVAARLRPAVARLGPERIVAATDCGMKYMPRDRAFGKLKAIVDGARIVRRELTGER